MYYSLLGQVVKFFEWGTSSNFKNRVASTLGYSQGPGHSRSRAGFYLDPNSIPGNLVSFVSGRVIFWVRLFKRLALTLTRACNFEIA